MRYTATPAQGFRGLENLQKIPGGKGRESLQGTEGYSAMPVRGVLLLLFGRFLQGVTLVYVSDGWKDSLQALH